MCSITEPVRVHHFKTAEMLHALGLTVSPGGMLWSVENGQHKQYLSWSAEEAITYVVGRMLEPEVREGICQNAVVQSSEALESTLKKRVQESKLAAIRHGEDLLRKVYSEGENQCQP